MRFIAQKTKYSCNVACLQMVLEHHGIITDKETIQENLPKHTFGSTIDEIERCIIVHNLLTTKYPSSNDYNRMPDGTFVVGVTKDIGGTTTPHYIVVEKRGATCDVYDPQEITAKIVPTEEILLSSRRKEQKNNVWLHITLSK